MKLACTDLRQEFSPEMRKTAEILTNFKVFWRNLAYLCKTLNEARCLPGVPATLRAESVQVVILDFPEICSEYVPYSFADDTNVFIDKASKKNKVAQHMADHYLTTVLKNSKNPVKLLRRNGSNSWLLFPWICAELPKALQI